MTLESTSSLTVVTISLSLLSFLKLSTKCLKIAVPGKSQYYLHDIVR